MIQSNIPAHRLHNLQLSRTTLASPGEVVDWLCAVQAQDFSGAKWALGLRLKGFTDSAIEQAFTDGEILRTHLLRPTWHFVRPSDIRWLLSLTAPRVHALNAFMYRKMELDSTIFARSEAELIKALKGGNQRTREELKDALEQAGIVTRGEQRMSYILMRAELDGLICSGPRHGKQFTYMLLEERVPPVPTLTREEALTELSRRYFLSRGPATVQDFAKWSGLTITDARNGLEAVKAQMRQEVVEGQIYWLPASTPDATCNAPRAYLLSIYDEYISSYKDRSAIGSPEYAALLSGLGNALLYVLVVDGQIAGSWRRTLKKGEVSVELNPFRPLTQAEQQAILAAAQSYGVFLGLSAVLA